MSVSRAEQVWRIRDLLDTPYPNKPSFHQIMRQELSEELDIANDLNGPVVGKEQQKKIFK